jgi:FtsP/CotA-like multicopper oxidase with cupredoxin domain
MKTFGTGRNAMRWTPRRRIGTGALSILAMALLFAAPAGAEIPGLTGTEFSFIAASGYIQNGDGNNLFFWGYADGNPPSGTVQVQYPGPTLIVNEGDTVTVMLTNWLAEPVSLLFPGMSNVTATPSENGIRGIFTWEAPPGGEGTVTYTFTASRPGTFYYQSGTNMDKQLEMGLFGAIIVRPAGFDNNAPTAYGNASSAYTPGREFLVLVSEMDDRYHNQVEAGQEIDTTTFFPTYWFMNGRNQPDTMGPAGAAFLPAQPYNCLPMMHPGDNVLLRIIGMGRDQHPMHHHSNHSLIIAWDGLPLTSDPGNFAALGANLAELSYSVTSVPGRTSDSIFQWTGRSLGWDVYGDPNDPLTAHACNDGNGDGFDDTRFEWCADHGKPLPVLLPDQKDVSPGPFYSGSPFLGRKDPLPPGLGNMNTDGSFFQIFHSHTEKEMTTNDVFPGGMMTFIVVVPPGIPIP